jgi:hypothetical protein
MHGTTSYGRMHSYSKGAPPDGALDSEFPSAPGGVVHEDYYPRLCIALGGGDGFAIGDEGARVPACHATS